MPIRSDLRKFYKTESWREAREAVRARAGGRCEHCTRSEGTFYENRRGKRVKVQCGAAHLNNKAGDDRPENMAWLCRACHLHHDEPFHKETRSRRKDRARPLIVEATAPYQISIEEVL